MSKFKARSLRGTFLGGAAFGALSLAAGVAHAQQQDTPVPVTSITQEDLEEQNATSVEELANQVTPAQASGERVVVTGSRIARDQFSSSSPIQVITSESAVLEGLVDTAELLQGSTTAAGSVQFNNQFGGFVIEGGPGINSVSLRGLGAQRSLVLINGRRPGPAGSRGEVGSFDLNVIPDSIINRIEILKDGASSVYGSDAVAGVVNIILRKDFDGLELQVNGDINPMGAGEDYTVSAAWGFTTDRAVFGIGAEYQRRDEVKLRDRDFLSGCDTHYEVDQNGNIRTVGLADNAIVQNRTPGVSVAESECKVTGISGRIFQPFTRFGSVYFPANGNIANFPNDPRTGRPFNFGESTNAFGVDLDVNGDGIRDVDFQNVNTNASEAELDRTFISGQELYNVFAYGEYTFPGEANITPFFEAQYTRAEISNTGAGNPQIFPSVPDLNEFNPCNFLTNPDGVDCRAVDNESLGITGTSLALSTGFPLPTTPIAAIRGDRNGFEVVQEQYRGVLGVRGDLPFIGSSWTFELAGSYSRSEGRSSRLGIREDRLALALGLDPTADYDGDGIVDNNGDGIADDYDQNQDFFGFFGDPQVIGTCNAAGLANPGLAAPDLNASSCVPVNLFAPSVLTGPVGDLATQAERDYIFGARTFDTTYEQTLLSGYVTGDLFELPAGPVGAVIGAEWRNDKIDSSPDIVASNGLFFGFFSDQGANGSKYIRELFGEVDIPLIAGETLVEELTINVSGRITDDEFYGTNGTYSLKGGWRPVSPLLLKFSYGTSFRAPNLRENFLNGQSGFLTLFDPCAVPDAAFVGGAYNAATDDRDQFVLDNCVREGRDPTTAGIDPQGLNTQQTSSVEITSGGTLTLDPETSRSITTGFAFEESFPSGFDFAFNFNYYDIKLKDSIIEPSAQFIINDCYTRQDASRSPFCDRITTDGSATGRALVSDIFQGFLNLDQESVRGIDINTTFGYPVTIGSEVFDVQLNLVANKLIERSSLFTNDNGQVSEDDLAGEFGFPDWTGRITLNVDWKDFRFTWQTRYIDAVEQDPDGIDLLSDAFGNGPDGQPTGFIGDTCLGGGSANVPGDGIYCRDIGYADEYFESSASVRWDNGDIRLIVGIANIFDETPPLVDSNEVFAISNVPIGNGYDLDGREFFGQLLYRF